MAEGNYIFDFHGTYLRKGHGGGGGGPPPEEKPWDVHAKLVVNKCDYENSGTDLNGTGKAKIIDKDNGGVTTFPVDVPIAGHNMGDVADAAVVPSGDANEGGVTRFAYKWNYLPHVTPTQVTCPKCADPIWHVVLTMTELDVTPTYDMYLPDWKQAGQAGPQAKAEWQAYYSALEGHEAGHVAIIKTYLSGDGQKVLDDVVKIEGWGEAHDEGKATDLAQKALDKALAAKFAATGDFTNKLQILQDTYDDDAHTQHGKNQQAVGGTNIPILNPAVNCGD